jgi:uncharacterized protein
MTRLTTGEFHRFRAAGREFLYLVPSAAVFGLDDAARDVLETLGDGPRTREEIVPALSGRWPASDIEETIIELGRVRAIRPAAAARETAPRIIPLAPFPLSTMVLNVTSQCNLSCAYCYEYGEDRIVDTANGRQPKFMSIETARESVDFLLRESGASPLAHLTFFGGETLLNFRVLQQTIDYARTRAAAVGKTVDFSLTTNATLLRPEIIEFLAENHVGVTVSIDGPREVQDKFRVFHDGSGSYDVIAPKIRDLLRRHRTRPIGARVTLTSDTLDVSRIFRHLTEEVGFWEVGFAPVTTTPGRSFALDEAGSDRLLDEFRELAFEFRDSSIAGRHHGFSNVKDTLEEIHKGVSKAYPCGAGLGLLGVSTGGDVAPCHRFAGSDTHRFGTVRDGIDRTRQAEWLETHHIDDKTDCSRCWARPLCAGGCYHEAYTRYRDTRRPNLHYCEWIRAWTDTCLQVYGALAERRPEFLARFDDAAPKAELTV